MAEKLNYRDARIRILEEPKRLMHSSTIEGEAFYRLRNYPKQIEENLHTARITIPRKVAFLLHTKPAYISPAIETFYVRDPIALKPLQAKDTTNLIFSPKDFVTVSVRFTRVGYAQLKSQDFPIPTAWKEKLPSSSSTEESARVETGMKLSCGFEMLLSDPQNQDKPAVREMKLLLEDLETGDDRLPTDKEIEDNWEKREDDEKWLDISFEDLEGELKGKARGVKPGAFGDQAAQENLQKIVAQFEDFLNDDAAGVDGAGLINESDDEFGDDISDDSSEGEDKEASFNEEEFSRMMKEMMGFPSCTGATNSNVGTSQRVHELESDESEDEHRKIQDVSNQMEAELKETGVLDLNRPSDKKDGKKNKGKTPIRSADHVSQDIEDDDLHPDDDEGDIDINLAKNLLESFQSQAGSAGPGGNLMGLMGAKLPRDDRG